MPRQATDPRRRLQQAVRRLRANITEVRHAAEALEQEAEYRTTGVPIPETVWRAIDILERWVRGVQATPPRRPWQRPPDD